MSVTVADAPKTNESPLPASAPPPVAQVGAASFSDLVRAHFRREQARGSDGAASDAADADFKATLDKFERSEGKLGAIYWSTRNASAVALTFGQPRARRNPFADTETEVKLHRLTDWVTNDAEGIAHLLHDCDLLAVRVTEVLRGTSERIAMRWLFAIQEHLLGFIERCPDSKAAQERQVVASQRRELKRVEEYYLRTAAKAGRIVYVSGMMLGATLIAAICALIVLAVGRRAHPWNRDVEILALCTGAGAVGALVSVLSRMSGSSDKFSVDFEVGRPLLRRLGLYKPLVGSVFGVAAYFLVRSGLLMTDNPHDGVVYFYGIIAFFAGFSERFTGVIFGSAQRLVTGEETDEAKQRTAPARDAEAAG